MKQFLGLLACLFGFHEWRHEDWCDGVRIQARRCAKCDKLQMRGFSMYTGWGYWT